MTRSFPLMPEKTWKVSGTIQTEGMVPGTFFILVKTAVSDVK